MLVHYEANPYKARLSRGTPTYWNAQCLAAHAPGIPHKLRRALKKSVKSDKALQEAEKELFKSKAFHALVGTTQAIDLINGGVKTNALPEQAWAVVNHRIATDRSFIYLYATLLIVDRHVVAVPLMRSKNTTRRS